MGIVTGPVTCDFDQLQKNKDKSVSGLTGGIEYLFKKNGVTYSKGWGKFAGPNDIDVDLIDGKKETISAKNIIIATGSEPNSLPESSGLATDE
jgi:dihydrolipoamide dehydrogenase